MNQMGRNFLKEDKLILLILKIAHARVIHVKTKACALIIVAHIYACVKIRLQV